MFLIAGLGNPGKDYDGTRHNIGFSTITRMCDIYGISLNTKKFKALCGAGVIAGQKVLLLQPQTFMNLSGESLREAMDFYKLQNSEVIVIYDDISLPVGKIRVRGKGSAGGHNGIKSIISHLGGDDFYRIRIGVGEKPEGWDLADYVLGRFPKEELPIMRESVSNAAKACETLLSEGLQTTMNRFNG